jgi:hypothetical protein
MIFWWRYSPYLPDTGGVCSVIIVGDVQADIGELGGSGEKFSPEN